MIIGLTGSIATGKSTVTHYLLSKGYPVIDSDKIAREVVAKGSSVLEDIVSAFGLGILQPDGDLDRKALGAIVFSDEEARLQLNEITHPAINAEMHRQIAYWEAKGQRLIFCDVPLLFEGDMEENFDEVWVVYVPEEIQVARLMMRDDIDEESAEAKINSQFSIEDKKEMADEVIWNDDALEKTYEQVNKILMRKVLC
ncbi:MAG: dephospho-CoA kinase [Clostridia bacterium]|nr:dephospho-CoA kinase [Clostridia bacterium]